MATAPVLLSIEEYLRTSYKPDVHYVDGVIEERHTFGEEKGEFEHNTFQLAIGSVFWTHRIEWKIQPVTEQRIWVKSDRVRIADIAVLRTGVPRESVTRTPPLLCIEIMSPLDRLSRSKLVLADYLAMGVEHVWLIDPIRRVAYTFDATGLHDADPTNLGIPNSPIHLDLTEAFAAID